MGRRLYVGNLPYTTGEAELQELFSRAGNVESVRVMRLTDPEGYGRSVDHFSLIDDTEAIGWIRLMLPPRWRPA